MGGDGENTGLKKVLPGIFEQTGVSLTPDDLVIDVPRLFARTHFSDQTAVTVPERELRDRRSLRNWKEICPLED
jgi:hypothetical protein